MAAFATYLPVFLREEGASLWFAGASLSVLEAGGVIGALVGGSASDVLGRRRVLAVSFLLTPILMFALVYATGWWRLPLLLPLGFAGLMATPVIMAAVQESAPENRALANGIYMALNFCVRALIVVAVGAFADWMGIRSAFLTCSALGLFGTPFIFWLPGRKEHATDFSDRGRRSSAKPPDLPGPASLHEIRGREKEARRGRPESGSADYGRRRPRA